MGVVDQVQPIARLRRIIAAAEASAALLPDDAAWLIAGVRRYQAAREAGLDLQLDRALSLTAPARHGWWREEPMAERNRLFHLVRDRHCTGMTDAQAAEAILSRLSRLAPRARSRSAEPCEWEQLRAAVMQSGRPLPTAKHLARLLRAAHMTPGAFTHERMRNAPPHIVGHEDEPRRRPAR